MSQAEHNLKFLKEINKNFPTDFFDWKITVAFYTAIHLTKALLWKRKGEEFESHEKRNGTLSHQRNNHQSPVTKNYWINYKLLYDESQKVRYDGFLQDRITLRNIQARDYEEVLTALHYILQSTTTELAHNISL